MTPTLISAFLAYVLTTALAPGLNNILALSSITTHSSRRNMRALAGMSLGLAIIMLICVGLTFVLVNLDKGITSLLRQVGIGCILQPAWHVVHSGPASGGQERWLVSFQASLGLQFINVRIILYGITALSTSILSVTRESFRLVMISLLLPVIGAAGSLCWMPASRLFQPVFGRHRRGSDLLLALLLVWCVVRIFTE